MMPNVELLTEDPAVQDNVNLVAPPKRHRRGGETAVKRDLSPSSSQKWDLKPQTACKHFQRDSADKPIIPPQRPEQVHHISP